MEVSRSMLLAELYRLGQVVLVQEEDKRWLIMLNGRSFVMKDYLAVWVMLLVIEEVGVLSKIFVVDVLKVYVSIQIHHWTSSWHVMSYWVLSDKITVINGGIVGRVLIVVSIVIDVISNRDRCALLCG
jgi:hypothetical protein